MPVNSSMYGGGFVNHQFQDTLNCRDRETRRFCSTTIKQQQQQRACSRGGLNVSPTTAVGGNSVTTTIRAPSSYEQWWYAQRDAIINKLDTEDGPSDTDMSSPSSSNQSQPRSRQGRRSFHPRVITTPSAKDANLPPIQMPQRPHAQGGSIQGSTAGTSYFKQYHYQNQLQQGNLNNRQHSSASRHSPLSARSSPAKVIVDDDDDEDVTLNHSPCNGHVGDREVCRVPGSEFDAQHPSHMYLHHGDVPNHFHEDLILHPDNTERLRLLEEEIKRTPARDKKTMSSYEKWWYGERNRVYKYALAHAKSRQ